MSRKLLLPLLMLMLAATACSLGTQPAQEPITPIPTSVDLDLPPTRTPDTGDFDFGAIDDEDDGEQVTDDDDDDDGNVNSGNNNGGNVNTGNTGGVTFCNPRLDWTITYTVQSGDTLSRLAQRTSTTVAALANGNCIADPNRLEVGQVLRVPRVPSSTPVPPAVPFVVINAGSNQVTLDNAGGFTATGRAGNINGRIVEVQVRDSRGRVVAQQNAGYDDNGNWATYLQPDIDNGEAGQVVVFAYNNGAQIVASASLNLVFYTQQQPSPYVRVTNLPDAINTDDTIRVRGEARDIDGAQLRVRVLDDGGSTLTERGVDRFRNGEWRVDIRFRDYFNPGDDGSLYVFAVRNNTIIAGDNEHFRYNGDEPDPLPFVRVNNPAENATIDSNKSFTVSGTFGALPTTDLGVRAVGPSGEILAEARLNVTFLADRSGDFSVQLTPEIAVDGRGSIIVAAFNNAGQQIAEDAVVINWTDPVIVPEPYVRITAPGDGATVPTDVVVVEGSGGGLPNNEVLVRALDANGTVLDSDTDYLNAVDRGQEGTWQVQLQPGQNVSGTNGTIEVIVISPRDGSVLVSDRIRVVYQPLPQPLPAQYAHPYAGWGVTYPGTWQMTSTSADTLLTLQPEGFQHVNTMTQGDISRLTFQVIDNERYGSLADLEEEVVAGLLGGEVYAREDISTRGFSGRVVRFISGSGNTVDFALFDLGSYYLRVEIEDHVNVGRRIIDTLEPVFYTQ